MTAVCRPFADPGGVTEAHRPVSGHRYRLSYTSCQESRRFDSLARAIACNTGEGLDGVKRAMRRLARKGRGGS